MKNAGKCFAVLLLLALGACSSQKPAPVVDRSGTGARAPAVADKPATAMRGAKDGIYTVQRGDTLYGIAMSFGVEMRELARWNELPDGSVLRVGQQLRVTPPPDAAVATVTPVTPGGSTEVRPLPAPGGPVVTPPLPPATRTPAPAAGPESAPPAKPDPAPAPAQSMPWLWPTTGNVIDGFDAPRNKGIDIGGNEGASVQAAADGEVVHVGSALRGYGNLVIIRHPGDFVTAYGHNRKILVSQGQQVKRGQQIAELGRTDSDRPKLHFEIRHQGKPLDPVKYLPPR